MNIDFFKAECQISTRETKFGLYDAEDNSPAILKLTNEPSWNATVLNNGRKTIIFTAIDNCIDVLKENGKMDRRCDCMIAYDNALLLVELKNKRGTWQAEGLSQIENIAKKMVEEIPEYYFSFKKRKAIVANRKNQFPSFQEINVEQRQYFSSKYKMRIQFEAVIIVD